MTSLLKQLKARRTQLGFKQSDMLMRVGMSRQQYQRLEAKGNPRLDTLELLAKGLNAELLLIPRDKLQAVKALLECPSAIDLKGHEASFDYQDLSENPWQGLLKEDEDS